MAEPVSTTNERLVDIACEQPIDDLIIGVKHVIIGD
jgi:hypothetical protein